MSLDNKDTIERLEIGLTSTCNLKCPLCMRQTHPELLQSTILYRAKDEIIQQIDEYKNLKFITIAGAISEPTLHPELFGILNKLIERGLEISLFINADTHNDLYYRKLGVIFGKAKGSIYLTIAGSTQELHEKYRVGSSLNNVISRLDILSKYCNTTLTWLVFNYNEKDFKENNKKFKSSKYTLESFNTLPVQEHFKLDDKISKGIHLVPHLHNIYKNEIDRNDFTNILCPAINYKFELVDHLGNTFPCIMYKLFGDKHCFECSEKNSKILKENKIYHLAEPEDESSEISMRY